MTSQPQRSQHQQGAVRMTSQPQRSDVQEDNVAVRMSSVIHPPGTNVEMQKLMRQRLPSEKTSSTVSSEKVEKMEMVMQSRMTASLKGAAPSGEAVGSAGFLQPTVSLQRSAVLQPKDTNIRSVPVEVSKATKSTPHTDEQESQEEDAEVMRDIETDPFFTGAHIVSIIS